MVPPANRRRETSYNTVVDLVINKNHALKATCDAARCGINIITLLRRDRAQSDGSSVEKASWKSFALILQQEAQVSIM
eukprot:IDg8986t1